MKKIISIALALLMVAVMLPVMAMADESTAVATLTSGGAVTEHDSLVDAVNAAINKTDAKIDVLKSSSGDGIEVKHPNKLDLTIDFHGHTYDVSGKAVGSKDYESQAWHIEKESKLTLMNGTLEASSKSVAMLFQNYSNLTLDNMVLNAQKTGFAYVMSNNNGDVVIKDTTIFAADGKVAFDVCRYADYVGPKVTVKGNSVINGKVEISSSRAKDGAQHELVIENGTFNGPIVKAGESHDFSSSITGGTFNTDVTDYVGENTLVVENNGKYYVGGTARDAIENATSGTFTVVRAVPGEGVEFENVNPGVTVKNGTDEKVTVNGNDVPNGKSYTVPGAPIIIYNPTEDTPKANDQKNPSTGANDFVGVAAAMAVVSLLGAAAVIRKK